MHDGVVFADLALYGKGGFVLEAVYQTLWLFFCYSFLGWVVETALAAVRTHRYVDRSLLFGPVCIIYGIAGLLIHVVLRELAGSWFFLFLGSAIYATVVEFLAGHLLERLTRARWWDYSGYRFNLDGYICLRASLCWGLLGVAVIKWVGPLLIRAYLLIPDLVSHILLWVLFGVFLVDVLATGLTLAGTSGRLPRVEQMGSRIAALSVRMGTWLLSKIEGRIQKAHPEATFRPKNREKSTVFAQGCCFAKLWWLFVIGAFLGDVVETLFCRATSGVWMSRSSLVWGDFSVVWGLAMAMATLLLYREKDKSDSFLFAAGTLLGGAYEYLCSVFTEIVFGTVFWDYSHIPFNLGGRINLLYCFFWGIAAVAWFRLVYPRLSALIEKVPMTPGRILTWVMVVFMVCNALVSSLALIRCDARSRGVEPVSSWEKIMDERFPDERMNRIYPAAVHID